MKTLRIFPLLALSLVLSGVSFGQKTTETFNVSGNCGMCKKKIEKAAKEAGASYASWDVEAKVLTVKYNSATTNTAKIQKNIAAVGYDNAGAKATDEAYDKLHGCCKYDREGTTAAAACCEGEDVCTDGKHQKNAKMDCCKDGKCSKPGHSGKDCCKKS